VCCLLCSTAAIAAVAVLQICNFFVSVITVPFHTKKGSQIRHTSERKSVSPHFASCYTMARGMRRSRAAMVVVMLPCICGFMSLQASGFVGQTSVVSDTHTRLLACVLSNRADSCWPYSSDTSAACVLACPLLFELVPKLEPSQFDDSLVLRLRLQAAVLDLLSQADADLIAHCCGMLLCASQLVLL
jgi:hypothetical protein